MPLMHRPTGSVEDDVDVWSYAILELHARNDDEFIEGWSVTSVM